MGKDAQPALSLCGSVRGDTSRPSPRPCRPPVSDFQAWLLVATEFMAQICSLGVFGLFPTPPRWPRGGGLPGLEGPCWLSQVPPSLSPVVKGSVSQFPLAQASRGHLQGVVRVHGGCVCCPDVAGVAGLSAHPLSCGLTFPSGCWLSSCEGGCTTLWSLSSSVSVCPSCLSPCFQHAGVVEEVSLLWRGVQAARERGSQWRAHDSPKVEAPGVPSRCVDEQKRRVCDFVQP